VDKTTHGVATLQQGFDHSPAEEPGASGYQDNQIDRSVGRYGRQLQKSIFTSNGGKSLKLMSRERHPNFLE
jgi:hypothetical protein